MAVPELNFKLHVPDSQDDVAEGDMESLFPHTPRNDSSWFGTEPSADLIEQALRPGHCAVPEGDLRDWMHRRIAKIGHAFNEAGDTLMAHTWFECAYASKAGSADLLSAVNMRLKLGQWAMAEQLYKHIVKMDLSESQREVWLQFARSRRAQPGVGRSPKCLALCPATVHLPCRDPRALPCAAPDPHRAAPFGRWRSASWLRWWHSKAGAHRRAPGWAHRMPGPSSLHF